MQVFASLLMQLFMSTTCRVKHTFLMACPPDTLSICYEFFLFLGVVVDLNDHDRNVVASLLKLYLRELPEPLIPVKLNPKLEEATSESLLTLSVLWLKVTYYYMLFLWIFFHYLHDPFRDEFF